VHDDTAEGLPSFYQTIVKKWNMVSRELTREDASGDPALGDSRARVLAVLRAARAPLGVSEIATRVGLHANTARFHLDALVGQGLAERATEARDVPGRPRTLYTATVDAARTGRRSYRLLAEILSSYLAAQLERPADAALEAGEAWGRFLIERPGPFRKLDAAAATRQLVAALDEIGFAPEAVTTGRQREIWLHHCPFREAAEDYGDVVCSVHLGLMRGMLTELGAPVEAHRLEPFVEPNLCVARLTTPPRAGGAARRRAG
jgi:predicted ArsR family transcriptional regulator